MSKQNEKPAVADGLWRGSSSGAGRAAVYKTVSTGSSTSPRSRAKAGKAGLGLTASDPRQGNRPLRRENQNSNTPPPTDHGDLGPIWYSFDLAHKRIQPGGWTHQVTQRELPPSTDLTGVNMRLTAGSFRELHWHTADEWAYMLYGNARVTVLNPDGTIFIDDVSEGDIWYFPAGFPHSIQGLGPDGCEFLLVFDQGMFSEEIHSSFQSGWRILRHRYCRRTLGWTRAFSRSCRPTNSTSSPRSFPVPSTKIAPLLVERKCSPRSSTHSRCNQCLPPKKRLEERLGWSIPGTSQSHGISPRDSSPSSLAAYGSCIGIRTPPSGSSISLEKVA